MLPLGFEAPFVADLNKTLDQLAEDKVQYLIYPLFHPRFRRDSSGISDSRQGPLTRADTVVECRIWSSIIIGKMSPWLNLESKNHKIAAASARTFSTEVSWAAHLSIQALITPPVTIDCRNTASCINQALESTTYLQLWVPVPLGSYPSVSTSSLSDNDDIVSERSLGHLSEKNMDHDDNQISIEDPWEAWNRLRTLADNCSRLAVALQVSEDVPSDDVIDRWCGEPIRAVIIPTSIFLTNRKGFPALSHRHQALMHKLFRHGNNAIQYYFTGRPTHASNTLLPYVQYMQFLYTKNQQTPSMQQSFEAPYLDFLQAPLQPLMDNLESQTYETFEKDPIKYSQYEKAITDALLDITTTNIVVTVVGAGRGPLVKAALRASELAQRSITVYAVEKNPNAVVTLRNLKISENWNNVTIISTDMRSCKNPPARADILVSELLGSFGDNELSPECLDGAITDFLKPSGVSIPCDYTSFAAPVMSQKLWSKASVQFSDEKKAFETPYVVKLHNFYSIATAQPVFTFRHPKEIDDNTRACTLRFNNSTSLGSTVHGIAGYFEATLYGEHTISINPESVSEGMFSWFPIFFPLRNPIYVSPNSVVEVSFWRKVSHKKVWYEWSVNTPTCTSAIHNPSGRSYWIGL